MLYLYSLNYLNNCHIYYKINYHLNNHFILIHIIYIVIILLIINMYYFIIIHNILILINYSNNHINH